MENRSRNAIETVRDQLEQEQVGFVDNVHQLATEIVEIPEYDARVAETGNVKKVLGEIREWFGDQITFSEYGGIPTSDEIIEWLGYQVYPGAYDDLPDFPVTVAALGNGLGVIANQLMMHAANNESLMLTEQDVSMATVTAGASYILAKALNAGVRRLYKWATADEKVSTK